jgi:hypothetical protein
MQAHSKQMDQHNKYGNSQINLLQNKVNPAGKHSAKDRLHQPLIYIQPKTHTHTHRHTHTHTHTHRHTHTHTHTLTNHAST